jgi:peptidoglycan-N-acetylglucosamine deacetylase
MSKFHMALKGIVFGLLCQNYTYAGERMVAITIDDLPFVGTNSVERGNLQRSTDRFTNLMNALVDNQVPATGFIIAGSIAKGQWELLEKFRQAGFSLGNHTYDHINLNRVGAEKYLADLDKAEPILEPIMTSPKYFRYPYLAEGKGEDKQRVMDYLQQHQYTIAPITIDSKDYEFNGKLLHIHWRERPKRLEGLKANYLAYINQQINKAEKRHPDGGAEILLIHANLLNSHCMNDVIQLFRKRGYRFITLDEALSYRATHQHGLEPQAEMNN